MFCTRSSSQVTIRTFFEGIIFFILTARWLNNKINAEERTLHVRIGMRLKIKIKLKDQHGVLSCRRSSADQLLLIVARSK